MTKIIKNTAGVVLYAGDTLALDAQHATNGDWIDANTTTANAALEDVTDLPADWNGGYYTHAAGVWARTADGQAAHDAAAAAAQAALVPKTVTRRQALQALLIAGKLSLVQPAIDAIPDATQRGLMQIEFDDSQVFERQRPALLQMAAALGMTSADLDQLFILADTL